MCFLYSHSTPTCHWAVPSARSRPCSPTQGLWSGSHSATWEWHDLYFFQGKQMAALFFALVNQIIFVLTPPPPLLSSHTHTQPIFAHVAVPVHRTRRIYTQERRANVNLDQKLNTFPYFPCTIFWRALCCLQEPQQQSGQCDSPESSQALQRPGCCNCKSVHTATVCSAPKELV
jgi:hypothetical protein